MAWARLQDAFNPPQMGTREPVMVSIRPGNGQDGT